MGRGVGRGGGWWGRVETLDTHGAFVDTPDTVKTSSGLQYLNDLEEGRDNLHHRRSIHAGQSR